MRSRRIIVTSTTAALVASLSLAARSQAPAATPTPAPQQDSEQVVLVTPPMPRLPNSGLGDIDQAVIPGQPWRVRDLNRPKPAAVTPGRHPGDPPSDAVVLFDGKDLAQWTVGGGGRGAPTGQAATASLPSWKVADGYMEVTPGAGSLVSKERFRDFQLHLEFATPAVPLGISQYRGNSGITIGGREIQILDNYQNPTYADGYVTAIYGQWPPLANASLPPGQWQTVDIAYMAARYEGERLVRNAFITVFLNGVMVHDNREIQPSARGRGAAPGGGRGASGAAVSGPAAGLGASPGDDQPIGLMGHPSAIAGNAIRYRNVWVRRVQVELPSTSSEAPSDSNRVER